VPGIFDATLADATIEIETEEAQEMARRLGREEGLLTGASGGANVAAALRVAAVSRGSLIVTVLPDGGDRYLSEPWLDNGGAA
jgi:cysteine synthase